MTKYFVILFLFFLNISLHGKNHDRIFIEKNSKHLEEKEAILILPGFGSKLQGTKKIADYFFNKGFDIYIPDFLSRDSISDCVTNLDKFIIKHKLSRYKSIHVFSYIIGAWTINSWITKNPNNNIATIIYDRSPLQERAPYTVVKDIPLIGWLLFGNLVKNLISSEYPPIQNGKIDIGIIIENKATKFISKHRKTMFILGPVNWDASNLKQEYDDKIYTVLNHDQMYKRFDIIGEEIFNFIRKKKFTETAKREPYTEDPFIKFE